MSEAAANKEKQNNPAPKRRYSLYFFAIVALAYIVLYFVNSAATVQALKSSIKIIVHIIPVLLFVILIMALFNYFLNKKIVTKYLGENAGIKGWLLVIASGILSHGPIYAWYPLLGDLREQGMRSGFAVLFMYNRAIKIPLLPVMAYYFGMTFVVLYIILIITGSILQAKIINALKV
ncbi:MAG: permease [Clostridiales bacterium]|nr:permease [Clostridiales bacterium]MCF8023728.1 permease [Clostridiales bacterium]